MNIFKKLMLQACFIGCLIPGASIIASQPETNISIVCPEEVQKLTALYLQSKQQFNAINAMYQRVIKLSPLLNIKMHFYTEETYGDFAHRLFDKSTLASPTKEEENDGHLIQMKALSPSDICKDIMIDNSTRLEYLLATYPNTLNSILSWPEDWCVFRNVFKGFYLDLFDSLLEEIPADSISDDKIEIAIVTKILDRGILEQVLAENDALLEQLASLCDEAEKNNSIKKI